MPIENSCIIGDNVLGTLQIVPKHIANGFKSIPLKNLRVYNSKVFAKIDFSQMTLGEKVLFKSRNILKNNKI